MSKKMVSLTGEVHISSHGVYTTVEAFEAMKSIGIVYGLYSRAEEQRDYGVFLDESGKYPALVEKRDVSLHGSPNWKTVRALIVDPEQIKRYLTFRDMLKMVLDLNKNEKWKMVSLAGEAHISVHGVYTTVEALEAMKSIGIIYGLYNQVEEQRDRCVVLDKNGERPALVLKEDFSYHGSPYWKTVCTITDDPKQIQRYLAFRDMLKMMQEIEQEQC